MGKKTYGDIPVLITENGWSDNGELKDNDRINYLHINYVDVAKAINEDGCNVIGHTVGYKDTRELKIFWIQKSF